VVVTARVILQREKKRDERRIYGDYADQGSTSTFMELPPLRRASVYPRAEIRDAVRDANGSGDDEQE
jgi:hypothetical protein